MNTATSVVELPSREECKGLDFNGNRAAQTKIFRAGILAWPFTMGPQALNLCVTPSSSEEKQK